MANTRNGNSFYIDTASSGTGASTTGNLAQTAIRVKAIIYRTSNATNQIVLKDVTTGATKLDLSIPTANDTLYLDLSGSPIVFSNGIAPTTLTAAVATLVVE